MDSRYAAPAVPAASQVNAATHTSGIGLGVTLIAIGLAALAVRLTPELSWATAWPLIFVIIGVVQMLTPSRYHGWTVNRLAEGFGTMLFGACLLGCTTGYIEWSMWMALLALWPLLLVVAGLHLLAEGSHQQWIGAIANVLVWGALALTAANAWTGTAAFESMPAQFIDALETSPELAAEEFADTVVDTVVGPWAASQR